MIQDDSAPTIVIVLSRFRAGVCSSFLIQVLTIKQSKFWHNLCRDKEVLDESRLSAEDWSCRIDDSSASLNWHVHKTEVSERALFRNF